MTWTNTDPLPPADPPPPPLHMKPDLLEGGPQGWGGVADTGPIETVSVEMDSSSLPWQTRGEKLRKAKRRIRELEAERDSWKARAEAAAKKASEWSFKLQTRPTRKGEILYITVPGHLHSSQMEALRDQLLPIVGEGKVVVLEGGASVA